MGILYIIVNPEPVYQIQGILVIFVIFIKSFIKSVIQNSIHTNRISSHILNHRKPAQIGLFIDGVIRSKMSRNASPHIHASYFKRFHSISLIQKYGLSFYRCFGSNRLSGVKIQIHTLMIKKVISDNQKGNHTDTDNNKFLHDLLLSDHQ